jgi:hypothetical protein
MWAFRAVDRVDDSEVLLRPDHGGAGILTDTLLTPSSEDDK